LLARQPATIFAGLARTTNRTAVRRTNFKESTARLLTKKTIAGAGALEEKELAQSTVTHKSRSERL
jgi:hypothetical protein